MKYVKSKGLELSVFSLGTVQLGMDYGLGEHTQKPQEEYAHALLNRAVANGVNTLDTANNYGESEKVIGRWLKTLDKSKRPLVVTKIGPLDHSSPANLRADIIRQTEKCMENLGVNQIDILMVHSFEDYEQDQETVRETFEEMKQKGMIRKSAISAYSRHDYTVLAKSGFDAVQIPLNVFDWSQIDNGGLQALQEAGMAVFVRSVFLQGLVFLKPEELDPRMDFCRPYLEKFIQLCSRFEMSPAVLALSFVLSVPGVTTVVLGCQTLEQLDNNCELISQVKKLTDEQMMLLHEAFVDMDPRVVNPGVWFNHT